MKVLKLNKVDLGSAAPKNDRPIWLNAAAVRWFEWGPQTKEYSVIWFDGQQSQNHAVAVREKPDEIEALLTGLPLVRE